MYTVVSIYPVPIYTPRGPFIWNMRYTVGVASQCFWDELMLLKCELMLLKCELMLLKCEQMLLKSKINTKKSANIVLENW